MEPSQPATVAAGPQTITEFLLARIAEDEKLANYFDPYGAAVGPRRVLAECAAKRKIVEMHRMNRSEHLIDEDDGGDPFTSVEYTCSRCGTGTSIVDIAADVTTMYVTCATLRALASVYSDHPAYRSEWA